MRTVRLIAIVYGVLALLLAAGAPPSLRSAPLLGAAPAKRPDRPGSLAANAEGDLYISFSTDRGACVVRRFSADGIALARWEVAGSEAARFCSVAESPEGGVWVALQGADVVRHYTKEGLQIAEWQVDGLLESIATASGDGTTERLFVPAVLRGHSLDGG